MRALARLPLVLLALLLVTPAWAEIYTIELQNGTVFQTRRQPEAASWDSNMVMILTDMGNWIAVPRADIVHAAPETETRGFGKVINTTTIDLGYAPNDAPLPEVQEGGLGAELDRLQQLLQGERRTYDQQQFVSPGQAGRGGLPLGFASGTGNTSSPRLVPVRVNQPAPRSGGSQ